jgi:hypothetical protein
MASTNAHALALGVAAAMLTTIGLADSLPYPETAKHPVSETFHGVTVVDNYRWLEDDRAPDVKQWTAAQNALTRRYLDAIPQRAAIAKQVAQLLHSEPAQALRFPISQTVVRDETATAAQSAVARRAEADRHVGERAHRARSADDRSERSHDDRLLSSFLRRSFRDRLVVAEWE